MSLFKRGKYWWYEFWFAGRRIQEPSKSASKSIAKLAEQKRRRELEEGFNSIEDQREEQVRTIRERAKAYLESYVLRNRSATFAEYAVKHINDHLADRMLCDIDDGLVREYQDARLRENAAPKTINEEIGFLLRLLGDRGDAIRSRLKKLKQLKLRGGKGVAKVYSSEEKEKLLREASDARSPLIYPILVLALETGMRNAEIRHLRWEQVNLKKQFLVVRQEQNGGWRRAHHSAFSRSPQSPRTSRSVVRGPVRPHRTGALLVPLGKGESPRSDAAGHDNQDLMEKRAPKGRREGTAARFAAHASNRVGGEWRRRPDDQGHRRSRIAPDAETLQPHPDESQTGRARSSLAETGRRTERAQRAAGKRSAERQPARAPARVATRDRQGPKRRWAPQGQAPKIDPKSRAAAQDCSPQRSETQDIERASLQKSLQSGQVRGKARKR